MEIHGVAMQSQDGTIGIIMGFEGSAEFAAKVPQGVAEHAKSLSPEEWPKTAKHETPGLENVSGSTPDRRIDSTHGIPALRPAVARNRKRGGPKPASDQEGNDCYGETER
jgi:hypothetical protein